MATTTIINSLTLTSIPALPSANANITGSVRLPQFKGLKIRPSLKTRSSGSLGQNPSSKLARGARVVCMAEDTADGGLETVAKAKTVKTNGIIYNRTPGTITFANKHDWHGRSEIPYPDHIESGKESQFEHDGMGGKSSAAVVYHVKNADGLACDILLAWSKDLSPSNNKAYTEIQQAAYVWDWQAISNNLANSSSTSGNTNYGCVSDVIFVGGYKATLSLKK